MSATVEFATVSDAEEILALQYLCYQSEAELYNDYSIPPLRQTLDELKAEFETHRILIAKPGEQIIGSVRANTVDDICFIGRLIVHPRYQRQGIGSRLMQAIEEETAASTYELFTGDRSEGNLKFYGRLGYSEVRRERISPQLELIFLRKQKA